MYDKMKKVEFDLMGHCNLNCPLCARNYVKVPQLRKLNIRPVEEIIAQIEQMTNVEEVYLVGTSSEPTLYPQIFELMDYLVSRNIYVEVCTNGSTNNPEWWEEFGTHFHDNAEIHFTVCGSTPELHSFYRKNSDLNKLLANHQGFRKGLNGKKVDICQHILFEYNEEDFKAGNMKPIFESFSDINLTETYYTRDVSVYIDQSRIGELGPSKDNQEKYKKILEYTDSKKHTDIQCHCKYDGLYHFNQFGKVFPCYLYIEESGEKEWDGSFDKIENNDYKCCGGCSKKVMQLKELNGISDVD